MWGQYCIFGKSINTHWFYGLHPWLAECQFLTYMHFKGVFSRYRIHLVMHTLYEHRMNTGLAQSILINAALTLFYNILLITLNGLSMSTRYWYHNCMFFIPYNFLAIPLFTSFLFNRTCAHHVVLIHIKISHPEWTVLGWTHLWQASIVTLFGHILIWYSLLICLHKNLLSEEWCGFITL